MTTKAVQRMYVGQFFQDTRPLLEENAYGLS